MIQFTLFGPLTIEDENGQNLRPKLMKSRAILAVLAATPGHCQSRSWLEAALWQDRQKDQAKSSLRSALADIRRHLGAQASALRTDHYEVALDSSMIRICEENPSFSGPESFLLGFDISNADGFEDWLREKRSAIQQPARVRGPSPVQHRASGRIYLATSANMPTSVPSMQCDALVDCIAKSTEDLGLADIVDGRGRGVSIDAFCEDAQNARCDLILISESIESSVTSINRIKVLESQTGQLIWSKSLVGDPTLDLDHPANVSVVAQLVEVLTERLAQHVDLHSVALSPEMMAVTGINHIFKLGQNNFSKADMLLERSHFENPTGNTLAWRALLKTFLIAEHEYADPASVAEEGVAMARHAVEIAPQNSMVLALCAHVQAMLRDDYDNAFDLAARALAINRCNPIAWACLGRAASFQGDFERGHALAQYGASLARATKYSFLVDSWASSTGLLAQDIVSAKSYCESSHAKAPSFAPPMRFLSALYCADAQFDRANSVVDKLRVVEPDFKLRRLLDDGYPSDTLKRANILRAIPAEEF